MKRFTYFVLLFLLVPAYSFSSPLEVMHISLIEGDVQIRTEDTEEWVPASINMPLRDGDRIWVPEGGKLELRLRDGTYLRLAERSALEVLTLEKDSFQFYLTEGNAYVNFRGQRGSFLQIDTPVSSVRAYDRSIFKVDLSGDDLHSISVLRGSVDVEGRAGKTSVKSGYTLSLKGETHAELSPLGPPDDWERWNTERDRRLAERRPPPSYLPEELHAYSADLDTYGRWVYVREYGYVWRPTVVISVGWAPYRIGRWVWIGGDYVWVSYEPWGWVPYHYGRWAFVASFGWCWVPPVRGAVYWGPGFVAWVRTPTYVAWVPLGPREIYYGHGHYGPYSVNIKNVNITNVHVDRTVYKNIHVRNAVTVVHHDTFVKGRHVDIEVKENPFLKEQIHVGRLDIRPERTTVMPVIKDLPPAKRPPEPIREIKVREIKEKRPLVRDRGASVLNPHAPPGEMSLRVREGKPFPRDFEKPRRSQSPQPGVEKSRKIGPPEKRMEAPKPMENRAERSPQPRPPERGTEKLTGMKSAERPSPQRQEAKSPEFSPELKSPERTIQGSRSAEQKTERIQESRVPEKSVERGGAVEKQRETIPTERGMERPEARVPEEAGSPRERIPRGEGVERSREFRQPEGRFEMPPEPRPSERGVERSKPPEIERGRSPEPRSMGRRQEGSSLFRRGKALTRGEL